jgi:OOP family OmpA-OmpF porin
MKRVIVVFSFIVFSIQNNILAQSVQWADTVLGFSSEFVYDKYPGQYLAGQILGKPNISGLLKANPSAWAPSKENNPNGEWIRVGFSKPQYVQQVIINETFNPGTISAVFLEDVKGNSYQIYADSTLSRIERWQPLIIKIERSSYLVAGLKVLLSTSAVSGYNQIDAIGILDSAVPFSIAINEDPITSKIVIEPERLDAINSATDDLCPVISPDGKTLYFTRQDHPENINNNQDIWQASINENNEISNVLRLDEPLNTTHNNSLASISPDGQRALVLNVFYEDGSAGSGVSIAQRTIDGWGKPIAQKIDDYINASDYGEYCLSNSGNILLMTVQRPESIGNKDIFVSFKKGENEWTKPVSLGPGVNTANSEAAPFLAADNRTLYYSTAGWPGYGSSDIFVTRRIGDSWTQWTVPQNLGPYLNTPNFDSYYTLSANGEYIYFSSARDGGQGKTDIYRAKLPDPLKPNPVVLVYGDVTNKKTGEPLGTNIIYYSLKTGNRVGEAIADPQNGAYKIVLPAGDSYGFSAIKEKFLPVSLSIDLSDLKEYSEVRKDLFLVPIEQGASIVMNNIYFDHDKSTLKKESFNELDQLIRIIDQNPNITIEIAGHTDDTGSDEYNLKLSGDRANAVVNYLKSSNISAKQLKAVGYGETKPMVDNNSDSNREKNRRVEFKVLSVQN